MRFFIRYTILPAIIAAVIFISGFRVACHLDLIPTFDKLQEENTKIQKENELLKEQLKIATDSFTACDEAEKAVCHRSMRVIPYLTSNKEMIEGELKCTHPKATPRFDLHYRSDSYLFCDCPNDEWDFEKIFTNGEVIR